MADYYVNNTAQPDSRQHEVHRDGCYWLDRVVSKHHLGDFLTCHPAVAKAKRIYPTADGCKVCSPDCHTS